MSVPSFCSVCGAANELDHTHCFACQQPLSPLSAPSADLLRGRYQIETCLGSGGYSLVSRARDQLDDRQRLVAIKQITLSGLSSKAAIEATEAFHREVRLLSELKHPQIPALYDHFGDQDHWYLVLEYIEGQTLDAFVTTRQKQGRPLQHEEILDLIERLCPILDYLHSRQPPVVFRDLKPDNVIRTSSGSLYLIDFGIARHYQPGKTQDTQRLGTPGYAAPEQYGRFQTTPQADIYSLGALCRFLISGQDPSEQKGLPPLPMKPSTADIELEELVTEMLSRDPRARPATIGAVVKALETIRKRRGGSAAPSLWHPSRLPKPQTPGSQGIAGSAGQVFVQLAPSLSPAASKRRLTRREALIGLGVISSVAAIGAGLPILQAATAPSSAEPPAFSPLPLYVSSGYDGMGVFAWSPDSKLLASVATNRITVQVCNALTGRFSVTYKGHSDNITGVSWSPDGKRIATSSVDGTVQVWNASNGHRLLTYSKHTSSVTGVSWSPDGKLLASSSVDRTVQVWDASNARQLVVHQGDDSSTVTVAWSPDSKRIASVASQNDVQVWDASTNRLLLTYQGHAGNITGLAWSPDGKLLASSSMDETTQVWDASSAQYLLTCQGDEPGVYAVAWSPDGALLASLGANVLQVWDFLADKLVKTYQCNVVDLNVVAWSPDGLYLAAGSLVNGTVLVWSASSDGKNRM